MKSRKPHHPTEEDSSLFREAVGPVNRLRHDRALTPGTRPPPVPAKTLEDQRRVVSELLCLDPVEADLETGEELLFARSGVQPRVLRKLRRGQYSVAAELDLHGLTAAVAKAELAAFLHACRLRDARCVRIIHGKGLRSRHGRPVLKAKLDHWLRQRDEVVAFSSARPMDGGTGAVYVLLKRG